MKQKIEWYREVLEIEPNSKIFFPLARMLAKDDRAGEAIAVLRQGVGRHPDHVEARLFLVELLYTSGRPLELQQEVAVLSDLFKQYPGFWRAWGERLFDVDDTRDAGLAAIFLAAYLQNLPVSWAGVIEHGLKSLVGGSPLLSTASTAAEEHPLTVKLQASPWEKRPVEVPPPAVSVSAPPSLPPLSSLPEEGDSDEEEDEPITIRTRSMAEVLAEQGDVAGALDIYAELLTVAPESEKTALQARIDTLSGSASGEVAGGRQEGGDKLAAQEEKKDWLSVLAQRLEARSLQQ